MKITTNALTLVASNFSNLKLTTTDTKPTIKSIAI